MSALDLASAPALVIPARGHPLPDGVLDVIRIAAGCEATLEAASRRCGKDPRFVKAAAEFYVQEMLLFQSADSYRVLGVRPGAPRDEMRLHMRWLITWLHPDRANDHWRTAFAGRVLAAWREVANGAPAKVPAAPAQQMAAKAPALRSRPAWRKDIRLRQRRQNYWVLLSALFVLSVAILQLAPIEWTEAVAAAQRVKTEVSVAFEGLAP